MPALIGLEGTDGREIECAIVSTVAAAIRTVRTGTPATAAGDYGALNAWLGDDGKFRAEYMRHMCTISKCECRSIRKLRSWLKEHWPLMSRSNDKADARRVEPPKEQQ